MLIGAAGAGRSGVATTPSQAKGRELATPSPGPGAAPSTRDYVRGVIERIKEAKVLPPVAEDPSGDGRRPRRAAAAAAKKSIKVWSGAQARCPLHLGALAVLAIIWCPPLQMPSVSERRGEEAPKIQAAKVGH